MLNIIITAVFKLIGIIGKIIITPIILLVTPLLNAFGFSTYANGILEFIDSRVTICWFYC